MENKEKNINKNKVKNRDIGKKSELSDPITEGVDTSIAMGIDTFDTPLPLKLNIISEEKES